MIYMVFINKSKIHFESKSQQSSIAGSASIFITEVKIIIVIKNHLIVKYIPPYSTFSGTVYTNSVFPVFKSTPMLWRGEPWLLSTSRSAAIW